MKYYSILLILLYCNLKAGDWKLVNEFEGSRVESVTCIDSNNCFLLNQRTWFTRLYKSTDQGITWDSIFQSDPFKEEYPFLVNAASGVSPTPDYYFMAMWDCSVLKKSTDGGLTFKRIYLDTCDYDYTKALDEFVMYDTNFGFGVASNFYYVTKNGWETFEKYPKLGTHAYYSPIFMDSNTVVMTYVANIRWNEYKGFAFVKYHINEDKWDTVSYFGRDSNNWIDAVKNLYFINDTLGFGCGSRNDSNHNGNYYDIIYKTTDGGNNWEIILKELNFPRDGLEKIKFHDAKNGVAAGVYKKIYITNDGGVTWVLTDTPVEWDGLSNFNIIWIGQHPFIGTDDFGGGLYRYEGDFFDFSPDTTVDTTDIKEDVKQILGNIEINVLHSFSKMYISIEDERFRKYKLQISDIMGNVVLEQELNSGIGTLFIPVDITSLTNGAYLYMISTGGIVVKTGKFIKITN